MDREGESDGGKGRMRERERPNSKTLFSEDFKFMLI